MLRKLTRPLALTCAFALGFGAPLSFAENEQDGWEVELEAAHRALEDAAEQIARLTRGMSERVLGSIAIETGERAILGVNIGPGRNRDAEGVEILGVSPGGPADSAGLKRGDLLLKIDAQSLSGNGEEAPEQRLQDYLNDIEPGTEVSIAYRREGETREVSVKTIVQPSVPPLYIGFGGTDNPHGMHDFSFSVPPMHFGALQHWGDMELVELTPGLGEYFGTSEGILVVRAKDGNLFGLRDGDVIQTIGGRTPRDPHHAMRILHSYADGESVEMTILRNKRTMQLSAAVTRPDRSHHREQLRRHHQKKHSELDT